MTREEMAAVEEVVYNGSRGGGCTLGQAEYAGCIGEGLVRKRAYKKRADHVG